VSERWRGHVFGLALDSACALAGCSTEPAAPELPTVRLDPADPDRVAPAPGAQPLTWHVFGAGRRVPDVRADPRGGYTMGAPRTLFHVSADGDTVLYATQEPEAWRWQRHLLGRVLPFAATLRGLEPVHASAVTLPAGAVLLAGEPGAGKTTLALTLALAGLGFLADDVVALSLRGGSLLAHPGPALTSLRPTSAVFARSEQLGLSLGVEDDGSRRVALHRVAAPQPVLALCLLERAPAAGPARIREVDPEPKRLLASSFNLALRDSARLARQLDVYAALARARRVVSVTVPVGGDPEVLAEEVLESLEAVEARA
jgi:hypothetical protein